MAGWWVGNSTVAIGDFSIRLIGCHPEIAGSQALVQIVPKTAALFSHSVCEPIDRPNLNPSQPVARSARLEEPIQLPHSPIQSIAARDWIRPQACLDVLRL